MNIIDDRFEAALNTSRMQLSGIDEKVVLTMKEIFTIGFIDCFYLINELAECKIDFIRKELIKRLMNDVSDMINIKREEGERKRNI